MNMGTKNKYCERVIRRTTGLGEDKLEKSVGYLGVALI